MGLVIHLDQINQKLVQFGFILLHNRTGAGFPKLNRRFWFPNHIFNENFVLFDVLEYNLIDFINKKNDST